MWTTAPVEVWWQREDLRTAGLNKDKVNVSAFLSCTLKNPIIANNKRWPLTIPSRGLNSQIHVFVHEEMLSGEIKELWGGRSGPFTLFKMICKYGLSVVHGHHRSSQVSPLSQRLCTTYCLFYIHRHTQTWHKKQWDRSSDTSFYGRLVAADVYSCGCTCNGNLRLARSQQRSGKGRETNVRCSHHHSGCVLVLQRLDVCSF